MQRYKYSFFVLNIYCIKYLFFTANSHLNVINSLRVYKREVNESSSIIRFPIMFVLDDIVIFVTCDANVAIYSTNTCQ